MIFFGRFHPLLVHLPIGIIFLAFVFEVLSLSKRYRKLRTAIQPSLFVGALFSLLSIITGYLLSLEGGYEEDALNIHMYAGLTTTLFAISLFFIRRNSWVLHKERSSGKPVRLMLFTPLILVLTVTGHFGGSLTHGEDFLTEIVSLSGEESDPAAKIVQIANVNEAVLYNDVIQPILESKCYSCHSSKKQKGELRLDGIDMISNGGKHGDIIETGNADSSELFSRLMLPIEDEHHMPPEEKTQLSSVEIDLIRLWINDGADFGKQIKNFQETKKISQFINLIVEKANQKSLIPKDEVDPADQKVVEALRSQGVLVLPVDVNSNYLMVNFVNHRSLSETDLQHLLAIRAQLLWLKLSSTNLTDTSMVVISKLDRLGWLYLDNTGITDKGITSLSALKNLRYLNLVNTSVSDEGLLSLKDIPDLNQVYLYNSRVTLSGIEKLKQQNAAFKIDKGMYVLPALAGDTVVHRKR